MARNRAENVVMSQNMLALGEQLVALQIQIQPHNEVSVTDLWLMRDI
jgi:hypothetical protein